MIFSTLGIAAVRSQEWRPTLPPWPDTVRLEAISVGENVHVKVAMEFPTSGYNVNWGSVTRIDDSTFSADAELWVWTGYVLMVITGASHTYDLGALSPGTYRFIFNVWGIPIKSSQFTHPPRLENALELEDLYNISLDLDFWLDRGSKLVVKFYTYGGSPQGENLVWTGSTPDNVSFLKTVPHPYGVAVEKARLVLTDNTDNVISTIVSFTVTRDTLNARLVDIYVLEWPFFDGVVPLRDVLNGEITDIYLHWPYAPF